MNHTMKFLWLILLTLACAGVAFGQTVIRAQDKLHVTCEEDPSLNRDYTVTNDGLLLMSFIGAVKVAGLTETQAAKLISDELVRQQILKKATIQVRLMTSEKLPVKFVGAIKHFGEVGWREGLKLSDIIKLAEPTNVADLSNILITSRTGESLVVDFARDNGNSARSNPNMKPGDVVTFSESRVSGSIYILGAVAKPGAIPFERGLSLKLAVEKCGGFLPQADHSNITLQRGRTPATKLEASSVQNLFLEPGDRIVIGLIPTDKRITIVGQVVSPGSVPFTSGITLIRALNLAGGLSKNANPDDVRVVRIVNGKRTSKKYSAKKIIEGMSGDPMLEVGDRVEVQGKRRSDPLLSIAGILIGIFILGG